MCTFRSRSRLVLVALGALGAITTPKASSATEEAVVQVAQPIDASAVVSVCTSTYIVNATLRVPGQGVELVCKSNCIVLTRGGEEDRNVAADLGLISGIDPHHYTGSLFGDTLRVFLDVSALPDSSPNPSAGPHSWFDRMVEATVEAVLWTAWYGRLGYNPVKEAWEPARYVDLEIRGKDAFSRFDAVYDISNPSLIPSRFACD